MVPLNAEIGGCFAEATRLSMAASLRQPPTRKFECSAVCYVAQSNAQQDILRSCRRVRQPRLTVGEWENGDSFSLRIFEPVRCGYKIHVQARELCLIAPLHYEALIRTAQELELSGKCRVAVPQTDEVQQSPDDGQREATLDLIAIVIVPVDVASDSRLG